MTDPAFVTVWEYLKLRGIEMTEREYVNLTKRAGAYSKATGTQTSRRMGRILGKMLLAYPPAMLDEVVKQQ